MTLVYSQGYKKKNQNIYAKKKKKIKTHYSIVVPQLKNLRRRTFQLRNAFIPVDIIIIRRALTCPAIFLNYAPPPKFMISMTYFVGKPKIVFYH